jgi:hypothetical protein
LQTACKSHEHISTNIHLKLTFEVMGVVQQKGDIAVVKQSSVADVSPPRDIPKRVLEDTVGPIATTRLSIDVAVVPVAAKSACSSIRKMTEEMRRLLNLNSFMNEQMQLALIDRPAWGPDKRMTLNLRTKLTPSPSRWQAADASRAVAWVRRR